MANVNLARKVTSYEIFKIFTLNFKYDHIQSQLAQTREQVPDEKPLSSSIIFCSGLMIVEANMVMLIMVGQRSKRTICDLPLWPNQLIVNDP